MYMYFSDEASPRANCGGVEPGPPAGRGSGLRRSGRGLEGGNGPVTVIAISTGSLEKETTLFREHISQRRIPEQVIIE